MDGFTTQAHLSCLKRMRIPTMDYRCEERKKSWWLKRRHWCHWIGLDSLFQKIPTPTRQNLDFEWFRKFLRDTILFSGPVLLIRRPCCRKLDSLWLKVNICWKPCMKSWEPPRKPITRRMHPTQASRALYDRKLHWSNVSVRLSADFRSFDFTPF